MNTLPDDVLCRCLARVPLADRVPAERVCKAWREAFASKAYTVARGACAEPVWLVMGGRDGTSRVLDQCHMLDSSLRKVAQLAPRHSASAGSAVIPGLGLLVMGGHGADHQHTRTARTLNLQGGSVWGVWGGLLPDSCSKPSICALGESIYVDCCYAHDAQSELLRYDKHGNLLETIQKPAAIRRPIGDAPVLCAINGRLFLMTRVTLLQVVPVIYRMDSYDPATGAWQRMPDPPIQGFGLNNGAVAHAGKLYVIGGNAQRITGVREEIADVRVFDGQEWSTGPPLPSPAVCDCAVSSAGGILAVAGCLRRAYVFHNGTWHSHSCEETELLAFPMVVPIGAAVAGHSA